MEFKLTAHTSGKEVFKLVQEYLEKMKLKISFRDDKRPWGGFLGIEESDVKDFTRIFFPGTEFPGLEQGKKLSPKILLVEPGKRLSWQYHKRRAEVWKVLQGPVEIVTSDSDNQSAGKLFNEGDIIQIAREQRHRLKGLTTWGIIAEIWQHTDKAHPSDEDDIVRVDDDFGRE